MICSLFFSVVVGLALDLDVVVAAATADLFGFELVDVFRLTDFLGEDSAEDDDCDR